MSENSNFITYLRVSPKKLGIYLFDINNSEDLYRQEVECEDEISDGSVAKSFSLIFEKLLLFSTLVCVAISPHPMFEIKLFLGIIPKPSFCNIVEYNWKSQKFFIFVLLAPLQILLTIIFSKKLTWLKNE